MWHERRSLIVLETQLGQVPRALIDPAQDFVAQETLEQKFLFWDSCTLRGPEMGFWGPLDP